jgi:rubredoxin
MSINPIEIAKDIINIGSTAGLKKDVVDLQAAKLRILTEQLSLLVTENTQLKLENLQLKTLAQNSQPFAGGFHDFEGVLWKRTPNGFGKTPYCPQCSDHPVMFGQPPMGGDPMLWQCSVCGFTADFSGRPR